MIDVAQASAFIEGLTGEAETRCTFQTFDDVPGRKDPKLAQIIHGTIHQAQRRLDALQAQRAGAFLTINATDLQGRTASNVLAVRALFVDADERELVLDERVPSPSALVQSARGKHAYWFLEGTDALAEFTPAQKRLAEAYGTDPKIHDLPRVMRLPGSFHLKDHPTKVHLLHVHKWPLYSIKHVVELLPERRVAARPVHPQAAPPSVSLSGREEQARRYVSRVPPAVEGNGGDEHTYRVACYVMRDFDLSLDQAWPIICEWNARCSPPWDEKKLRQKLEGAIKYGTKAIGNKLRDVRRAERFAGFQNGMRP